MKPTDLLEHLERTLSSFDFEEVDRQGKEIILDIQTSKHLSKENIKLILNQLKKKRRFKLISQICEALIITNRQNTFVLKIYIQALIDLGLPQAALYVIHQELDTITEADGEWTEWMGLRGRAYKQLFLDSKGGLLEFRRKLLTLSIQSYLEIYDKDREKHYWHGINVVALCQRGEKDGFELDVDFDVLSEAQSILDNMEHQIANDPSKIWFYPTGMEASIALDNKKTASKMLEAYAKHEESDAFEIGSTLRQLVQVWKLEESDKWGNLVLPILNAKLLEKSGGTIKMQFSELKDQLQSSKQNGKQLEAVFGSDLYKSYQWYVKGMTKCTYIGKVSEKGESVDRGFGTGFLVKGSVLSTKLAAEDYYFMTNAHVINDNPGVSDGGLLGSEAQVIFDALGLKDGYSFDKVIWSSPLSKLDTTILSFKEDVQLLLKSKIDNPEDHDLQKARKVPGNGSRVYIIGHPKGGILMISLQDNLLIAQEAPLLHYRAPTDVGSSGSPVFNGKWQLIGIHHAGGHRIKKLGDEKGAYQANEGIMLQDVIQAFEQDMQAV